MENGIDQGEIISPLLWIIYYNPLFERIKTEAKGLGYTIISKHNYDFIDNLNDHTLEIYNLAYMDDMTWLAYNKAALQQLIIADSFNNLNSVQVNPKKSELIVINRKEPEPFIIYGNDSHKITALLPNQSTCFLGVWIVANHNKKFIKEQITHEIESTVNLLKKKSITSQNKSLIFLMQ
jgi:hypothetical protein